MKASAFTSNVPMFSAVRRQPVAPKSLAVRRRYIGHVAILIAMGILFSLAYVWIRIQAIQLGYEVSRVRKEVSDLSEQKSRLEAEVETLKSPTRIEVIAREKYGMRLPLTNEVVVVGEGQ